MGDSEKLGENEIAASLASVRGWSVENGKLLRKFVFPRFVEAFGFMASVAPSTDGATALWTRSTGTTFTSSNWSGRGRWLQA